MQASTYEDNPGRDSEIGVNAALVACNEILEGENHSLKEKLASKPRPCMPKN